MNGNELDNKTIRHLHQLCKALNPNELHFSEKFLQLLITNCSQDGYKPPVLIIHHKYEHVSVTSENQNIPNAL